MGSTCQAHSTPGLQSTALHILFWGIWGISVPRWTTLAGRGRTRPSGIQTNARGVRAEALLRSDVKTFSLFVPIWKATVDSDYVNMCRRHNIEAKWEEGEIGPDQTREP